MKALAVLAASGLALAPRAALAHCDTLDGPVVKDGRAALESNDVAPVLKWVQPDDEPGIREAFREPTPLAKMLAAKVDEGVRLRHARAAAARPHAGESVAKGRAYVAAYVELMHYAERFLQAATTPTAHGGAAEHVH